MPGSEPVAELSWIGDRTLRIVLGQAPSAETEDKVLTAYRRIGAGGIPGLRDVTPAYTTLVLSFDPHRLDADRLRELVLAALETEPETESAPTARTVEIPVCYEPECAPDLEEVAAMHKLSAKEVIAVHAGADYVVRFFGFSPGFPYLSGLPDRLRTPRLERPRIRVPAGSVAIAGSQAGIYPSATPGGWRLLGRTPLRLFDPDRGEPSLLAIGDRVRFVPISLARFEALARDAG